MVPPMASCIHSAVFRKIRLMYVVAAAMVDAINILADDLKSALTL